MCKFSSVLENNCLLQNNDNEGKSTVIVGFNYVWTLFKNGGVNCHLTAHKHKDILELRWVYSNVQSKDNILLNSIQEIFCVLVKKRWLKGIKIRGLATCKFWNRNVDNTPNRDWFQAEDLSLPGMDYDCFLECEEAPRLEYRGSLECALFPARLKIATI